MFTDGDVVSLTRRPSSTHEKDFLVLISATGCVNHKAIVRLEALDKLEKVR
jgi:hypothetical protein